MPLVQLLDLLIEHDDFFSNLKIIKNDIVQAEISEIGDAHGRFQVPPIDELLNYTTDEPLDWDPVVNFRKNPTQTDASYKEQVFAIKVCVESINSYLDFMNTGFVKYIFISGFPGGRKTFVTMYIVINDCSK